MMADRKHWNLSLFALFVLQLAVTTADAQLTTVTTPDKAVCVATSIQLQTTPSGGSSYTYSWSPSTGLSSTTISNPVATPAVTTVYVVTITDVPTSNSITDSVKITVQNIPPPIEVLPANDTICAGDTVQLQVINSGSCTGFPGSCQSASSLGSIGSGSFTGLSQYENPFYQINTLFFQVRSTKRQIIYTKSELNAAGIFGPTNITSLSFNLDAFSSSYTYQNFKIDMGCTSLSAFTFTSSYITGLSNVFSPKTISISSSGWKEFSFDKAFSWDGQSNLVIEICYVNNTASSSYPGIIYELTAVTNARVEVGNTSVCASSTGNIINRRPNIKLRHCDLAHLNPITFAWLPASGLSATNVQNPQAYPSTTTSYIVTVTDSLGCYASDTANLYVASNFNLSINTDTFFCSPDTLMLNSVDNAGAGAHYKWKASANIVNDTLKSTAAAFTSQSKVTLDVTSAAGCAKKDSFQVYFNPPVSIDILTADSTICNGDSIPIDLTTSSTACTSYGWLTCKNPANVILTPTSTFASGGVTVSPYDGLVLSGSPGQKKQFLILASELTALNGSNTISALGFNLQSNNTNSVVRNGFTIKMGCTNISAFSSTFNVPFEKGLQLVFGPKTINISTGWKDLVFDSPFVWDGSSNIIVEICWQNSASLGTGITTINYSITSFVSVLVNYNSSNYCADSMATLGTTIRPDMRLRYCDSPPNPNYKYLWTPASGISNSTSYNVKAAPSATTNYVLQVTDTSTGCADKDSILITVAPNFQTNVTPDSVLCSEDSVNLSVTHNSPNPVTYKWNPPSLVSSVTTPNTDVYVNDGLQIISEVKSSLGCIKWDTVALSLRDPIELTLQTSGPAKCAGDSVQIMTDHILGCGKSTSFLCNPSSSIQIGTSTSVSSQFNTTPFVATDLSSKKQFLITKSELNGAGFTTSGQISSVSFQITVLGMADYENFKISMGCTSSNSLNGSYVGNMGIVFKPKSVTLTQGLNWFDFDNRFNWDGQSNLVIEMCYVNSGTGVNSEVEYNQPTPVFNCTLYSRGTSICNSSSGTTYNRRPNMGFKYCSYVPSNFNYLWSPPTMFNDPGLKNPTALLDTPGKYILQLTDLTTDCEIFDSLEFTVKSFNLQANPDTTLCNSLDYQLDVMTDAVQPKYKWSPSGQVSNDTVKNPKVTIKNGSNFIIEITDSSGCSNGDTVHINLLPNPVAVAPPDIIVCREKPVLLAGSGGGTYSWSPAKGLSNPSSSSPMATVSGTTVYVLTVTNSFGCEDEDSVTVDVYSSPMLDLGPDTTYCLGGYIELNASPLFETYKWQDESQDSVFRASSDGKYWVLVTDSFNCSFTDTVDVGLRPPPATNIRWNSKLCEGDSLILNALNPGSSYQWSTGESTQTIVVKQAGKYSVVIDDGQCKGKDSTTVSVYKYPVSPLPEKLKYCEKEYPFGITLIAGAEEYRYKWDNGQVTNSIIVSEEGDYTVVIKNGQVCEITKTVAVKQVCSEKIFAPNSFTPNNDLINDVFKVYTTNLDQFELRIYNRWGEAIYITSDPDFEWDGTYKGEEVPQDSYIWKLFYKIRREDGSFEEKSETGTVLLIR